MKALTQDEGLLRQALASSLSVSIVEDRIKAIIKPGGRNTLILREIPSDAPDEEVREIFAFESCKPISSIRSDIENTWYVACRFLRVFSLVLLKNINII